MVAFYNMQWSKLFCHENDRFDKLGLKWVFILYQDTTWVYWFMIIMYLTDSMTASNLAEKKFHPKYLVVMELYTGQNTMEFKT